MKITFLVVKQSNTYIFQLKATFPVAKQSLNKINGDYLSRGQSASAATTQIQYGYYLSRGQMKSATTQIQYGGYLSRGQMKSKTKRKINTILVNEGALASTGNISSEGAMLAKGSYIKYLCSHPTRLPTSYPTYIPRANPTTKIEYTY